MNPLAAAVFIYLLLAVDLAAQTTGSGVMPLFVLPGIILISLFAPAAAALWTALLAGLLVDLCTGRTIDGQWTTIIGPAAVSHLVAAYFTVTIRGMMLRRTILAWVFMAVVGAMLASCAFVILLTMRSWFEPGINWETWRELSTRLLSSLYAGLVMAGLWLIRRPLMSLLSLSEQSSRSYGRR